MCLKVERGNESMPATIPHQIRDHSVGSTSMELILTHGCYVMCTEVEVVLLPALLADIPDARQCECPTFSLAARVPLADEAAAQ